MNTPDSHPSDCDILAGYRARNENKEQMRRQAYGRVLLERARNVRLLLFDVDGVFTDGTLLYSSNKEEYKAFNTLDGFGITLLHEAGIETGLITARKSPMVQHRAEELKMTHIYQGVRPKTGAFREILEKTGYRPFEIGYMGDDWLDLPLLSKVGLAVAPANGADEIKEMVHFITPRQGGHGAVRDVCTLLLTARGILERLLKKYQQQ